MGYTKNIAVIREIKKGFSADGGELSGLVKAEKYGAKLRVEVSLINFAPLTEGAYVMAISDGAHTKVVENGEFEGECDVDTANGFAALICYIKGQVFPVASAVCGNFHDVALGLKAEIEREENLKTTGAEAKPEKVKEEINEEKKPVYEDEAIAEVNYYEYAEAFKDGGAVRTHKEEEESGGKVCGNEAAFSTVEKGESGVKDAETQTYSGGNGNFKKFSPMVEGGLFYERMADEIDDILKKYPKETPLEEMIEDSKWVKISYGEGGFYVFGVLYSGGKPKYICYGVPAENTETPPESMEGMASFLPASADKTDKGFWVMYQDAETGASLRVDLE